MIEAIIALVVVLVAGGAYLAWRHRTERGIESGISSFRRELSALAPRRDQPRVAAKPQPPEEETASPAAGDDGTVHRGDGADPTGSGAPGGDPDR